MEAKWRVSEEHDWGIFNTWRNVKDRSREWLLWEVTLSSAAYFTSH